MAAPPIRLYKNQGSTAPTRYRASASSSAAAGTGRSAQTRFEAGNRGGDPQPVGGDHHRIMASSIDQHRPGVGRALINRQRPHGARTPLVRQRAARGRHDALCRQAIFAKQPLHRSGGQKAEKAHPFRRNRVMRCAEFDHRAAQATPDRGLFPGDEGPCGGGMQRLFVQGG